MNTWISSLTFNLSQLFFLPSDHDQWSILVITGFLLAIVFGRSFATSVFKCKNGMFAVILTVLVPVTLLLLGLSALDIYVIDKVPSPAHQRYLQIGAGIVVFMVSGLLLATKVLDLKWWKGLVFYVFVYGLSFGAVVLARSALDAFFQGSESIQQYQNRSQP